MRIRIEATPSLNGTLLDTVRRVARAPLNQLQAERRQAIRELKRRRFPLTPLRQLLGLTPQQLIEASGPGQSGLGAFVDAPDPRRR